MDLIYDPTTQSEACRGRGDLHSGCKRYKHQLSISVPVVGCTVSDRIIICEMMSVADRGLIKGFTAQGALS